MEKFVMFCPNFQNEKIESTYFGKKAHKEYAWCWIWINFKWWFADFVQCVETEKWKEALKRPIWPCSDKKKWKFNFVSCKMNLNQKIKMASFYIYGWMVRSSEKCGCVLNFYKYVASDSYKSFRENELVPIVFE